jgi:hypothetical protein
MTTNKDTDLREAVRRRYAHTPPLPAGFTDRLMERMDTKPVVSHRRHGWGWMSAAAACLLIAIGIGVYHKLHEAAQPIAQSDASNRAIGCVQSSNRPRPIEQSDASNRVIGHVQSSNRPRPIEQSDASNRASATYRQKKRTRPTEIPDTLGNGIWRSERNVALAIQMLSECEKTIQREEQEMRNHIIQATFNATPQPDNAVLVTNEAGDYEVIETKTVIEI